MILALRSHAIDLRPIQSPSWSARSITLSASSASQWRAHWRPTSHSSGSIASSDKFGKAWATATFKDGIGRRGTLAYRSGGRYSARWPSNVISVRMNGRAISKRPILASNSIIRSFNVISSFREK